MNLIIWQTIYVLSGILLLPFAPFLYMQGQYVRRKIGRLPDAQGEAAGKIGEREPFARLLVIGESTAAGVGARTHETALAGQFARFLSAKIEKSVDWHVIGRSGITVKETIYELVPKIPAENYDYVLVALCGNEVLKLRSPRTFRRDMKKLLGILREKNPDATFFITNAPAVRLSPVLPHPIKFILGHLSALHDANAREFTTEFENVFYFHQPTEVPEDFFADGIHPSEKGYTVWSKRMIEFFTEKYQW
ncbi:MAG TPA: SGNH/GDSL hydrolase family protein [Pyrinomonadaceae bacterium]|jgi:lysophospholipase L1-like esterase